MELCLPMPPPVEVTTASTFPSSGTRHYPRGIQIAGIDEAVCQIELVGLGIGGPHVQVAPKDNWICHCVPCYKPIKESLESGQRKIRLI